MVNNQFFLPVQEFPLWNSRLALIGRSGEVKLSCIGKELNTICSICLVSMEMNAYHCVHNQKGPRLNHSAWHLSYNSVSSSEYRALFALDLSVCHYVIFKHFCPSDLTHKEGVNTSGVWFSCPACAQWTLTVAGLVSLFGLSDAVHSSSSSSSN